LALREIGQAAASRAVLRGESEHHGTAVAQHRDVLSILQTGIWMDPGKIKTAGPIDEVLDA
jgi:hypothetical protein